MIVFVDSSFLIALFHKKDDFHSKAKRIVEKLEKKPFSPFTSNIVTAEVVNFLFRTNGSRVAKSFLDFYKKGNIKEIFVSKEIFDYGYRLLFKQKSKRDLNLFDCLHLTTMKSLGIKTILTFDKEFKKWVKVIGAV